MLLKSEIAASKYPVLGGVAVSTAGFDITEKGWFGAKVVLRLHICPDNVVPY